MLVETQAHFIKAGKTFSHDMRTLIDVLDHHELGAYDWYAENDTYEFYMPLAKAQPMEAYEPSKCPECGAPVQMHMRRAQRLQ